MSKKRPTPRQIKAFTILSENVGTLGQALKEAGYSENVQKTPARVTETDGWQLLLQKHLPDELLTERHQQLLNKKQVIVTRGGKIKEVGIETQAVSKGLDMAYKLKSKYAPEKHEIDGKVEIPILAGILNVHTNNSNEKNSGTDAKN